MGFDEKCAKHLTPKMRKHRSLGVFAVFSAISVLIFVLTLHIFFKARPLVLEMAQNRAGDILVYIINDAVGEENLKMRDSGQTFCVYERDENGKISSVSADTAALNSAKAEILKTIQKKAEEYDSIDVRVPIGAIFDSALFGNFGPKITFKLIPNGFFNADFSTSFTSAGINQTKHEININVTAELGVMSVIGSETCEVTATVLLVQNIIVGNIPETHLQTNSLTY